MSEMKRRSFLKAAVATAVGAGLGDVNNSLCYARTGAVSGMPTRRLGRTNHEASIFSLGGMFTVQERDSRDEAVAIIHRALDLGVNCIDTAEAYGDGGSELNIGEVMRERRSEVFLATKTRERRAEKIASELFERSCERLQTDCVDLYFCHGVHTPEVLEETLDRETGAITAIEAFREQGRIRFIGISSHSSELLLRAMEQYDFDCVFVTMNPAQLAMNDPEDLDKMLAAAAQRDVGVIAMKVFGGGGGRVLEKDISAEQAFRYALSRPISTAAIGISNIEEIEANVRLAQAFVPYNETELAQLRHLAGAQDA